MPSTQVIVTDDDGDIRNLIAACLVERGFRVKQAVDGFKALQLIEMAKGMVLLVTDLRMPRMSGQELIERALSVRPDIKVVLMTGFPGELPVGDALRAREIKTFVKPFNLPNFCDYVADMLNRPQKKRESFRNSSDHRLPAGMYCSTARRYLAGHS